MDSEIKKSTIFDDILYLELIPWQDKNKPDELFADKISQLKTILPEFQPRYETKFHRPFNAKTKFYEKLILNKSVAFCNEILHLLDNEGDIRILKYFKLNILERDIPDKLKELGKILADKQYSLDYINPRITTFNFDQDHKTETFIMQLLKVALMWCYLEIQCFFSFIPPEELLIEDDFYTRFLFEPVPGESFIKELPAVIMVKEDVKTDSGKAQKRISDYSFTYKYYQKSPDKITYLYQSLKDSGFIADNTSLANFKKAFTGKEITKPIMWKKLPSDLYYFIKLIYPKHMEDLKQQQWTITCKLFVDEKGNPYDKNKIRLLKKPSLTSKLLERAVNNLK